MQCSRAPPSSNVALCARGDGSTALEGPCCEQTSSRAASKIWDLLRRWMSVPLTFPLRSSDFAFSKSRVFCISEFQFLADAKGCDQLRSCGRLSRLLTLRQTSLAASPPDARGNARHKCVPTSLARVFFARQLAAPAQQCIRAGIFLEAARLMIDKPIGEERNQAQFAFYPWAMPSLRLGCCVFTSESHAKLSCGGGGGLVD